MNDPAQDAAIEGPSGAWRRMDADRSDRRLVRDAKRGSADAAEGIVRRHWNDAHHTAFLVLGDARAAEDVAQESLLAALRTLDRFDERRDFRPWLHRIVVNRSLDWVRARARRAEVDLGAVGEPEARRTGSWTGKIDLASVDPETRAIVVLRYLLDYRSAEIAEMFDMTPGAIRTRLHRALPRLRAALRGEQEEDET